MKPAYNPWLIIFGLAVILFIGFGTTINSMGVFAPEYMKSFAVSAEKAGNVSTAFLLTMTIAMPFSGWLMDYFPAKRIMALGVLLSAAGFILAHRAMSIDSLMIDMALSGAGIGLSTYVPAFTVVSYCLPEKHHGMGFGVLMAAASAGGIFMPYLLAKSISEIGWKSSELVIGGSYLFLSLPAALLLVPGRKAAPDHGAQDLAREGATQTSLLKSICSPKYWIWVLVMSLINLSALGIVVFTIPILVASGYQQQTAALIVGAIGIATFLGSLLAGILTSRFHPVWIMLAAITLSAVGLGALLKSGVSASGLFFTLIFVLVWGSTFNLINVVSPLLLESVCGRNRFGSLLGIGNFISGIISSLGPALVGFMLDRTHTYDTAIFICAAIILLSLFPTIFLKTRAVAGGIS